MMKQALLFFSLPLPFPTIGCSIYERDLGAQEKSKEEILEVVTIWQIIGVHIL